MALIKITRNTVCAGKAVNVGDIVNAADADCKVLIGLGKAVLASEKEAKSLEKPEIPAGKKSNDGAKK